MEPRSAPRVQSMLHQHIDNTGRTNDFLRMKQTRSTNSRTLHPAPLRMARLAVAVVTSTLISAKAHAAAELPDLGDSSNAIVTEQQERTIAKRIMLEIRGDRAFVEDPELADYIRDLGNRMISASRGTTVDNRRDFEFFFLNDNSVNAFAILGGLVGFHSGLMLLSTNESELAGVMGHEIAHVLQRHQARGADEQRKNAPLQLLALAGAIAAARSNSASSGQATEALVVGSAALSAQQQLDYTRDFEREADRLGIQIMARAGFDPQGMPGFFDRLLKANRHNDGKAPGYLRTHPLTTERIAEMQDRVAAMGADGKRSVPDTIEYKLAHAKFRVMSMSATDAATLFRNNLAQGTILRNRADTYGLAFALLESRNYAEAEKELAKIRNWGNNNTGHPWIENLAARIKLGQRKWDDAAAIYQAAIKRFPGERALNYGYIETLYESGQTDAALAAVNDKLRVVLDDAKYYELAAKGYERKNKKLAQHRAIGESYFRRGNLRAAIDQYEIASKAKDGDFYESSSVESRLRELKQQFRNRPLMPGEKRDTPLDKELEKERPS
jgi:beta-barrel assembly-enhancing protease